MVSTLIAIVVVVLLVGTAYRLGMRETNRLRTQLDGAQDSVASSITTIGILEEEKKELIAQIEMRDESLENKTEEYKKLLHQKKSSEVRTGQIAEQMAPFLEGFPYDPKKAVFLGNPLDFVVFDDDGVHFVEVKSGRSQLTAVQRKLRDKIEAGLVTFEVYRVKGE